MIELTDTHCHIHFLDYELEPEQVVKTAVKDGVVKLMCVGCTLTDSKLAVEMAKRHKNIWATIGLHPHEGAVYVNDHKALQEFRDLAVKPEVVAIGETGLDYHYMHSSKEDQEKLLRFQLDIAVANNLPLVFHVREAFTDFWNVIDEYKEDGVKLSGVVHSFSSNKKDLQDVIKRGFYVGLNGIMTFTKDGSQLEAAKTIPLNKLLLETDAPFLTPVPFRGKICEPKHVRVTAQFLADLRGESLAQIASATTRNATELFNLK